jgi:hypothetical protein
MELDDNIQPNLDHICLRIVPYLEILYELERIRRSKSKNMVKMMKTQ